MKNPYNPETEPHSYAWFEQKPKETIPDKSNTPFTKKDILEEMETDLIEEGLEAGHVYSLVFDHWKTKYLITRR